MKVTIQLERLLRAFLVDPTAGRYGYDLMKVAKLASGTLYPALSRLEAEGIVRSEWQTPQEGVERPRKNYYLDGEAGISRARAMVAQASLDSHRSGLGVARQAPGRAR